MKFESLSMTSQLSRPFSRVKSLSHYQTLTEFFSFIRLTKSNNGAPPKDYKGGRMYKNIPLEEKIVIGDDNSVWYTNDHYYTFTQIE